MADMFAYAHTLPDSPGRRMINRLTLEIFESGEAAQREWAYRTFQSDPFFRLYYAIRGSVTLKFAHSQCVLRPHHLYLLPANVPFRYVPRERFHHLWLHFCSPLLEQLPAFRQVLTVSCRDFPRAGALMRQFVRRTGEHGDRIDTLMTLNILLRQLLTPFLSQLSQPHDAERLHQLDRFSSVLDYIAQHLNSPLEIPHLAALLRMSRGTFSAGFRQAFGVPPKQYIVQCRIDRAKILLVRTDSPVAAIAAHVGYDNEFFFYRIFKKYTATTPDEYRRLNNLCLFNSQTPARQATPNNTAIR